MVCNEILIYRTPCAQPLLYSPDEATKYERGQMLL